jgi:divalent metal cation (Fe/Co/Zn/Cd) transporter
LISARLRIPYVDSIVSILITLYLIYVAVHLLVQNLQPLVDHRVLDPREVERVAASIDGVLHCHHIRSRGEKNHHFLDLNIHLPGHISLERAHEITHTVEARLKAAFPGLVDVVIHTEPDGHPPCDPERK